MAQIMAKSPAQCGTSWYNSVAQCGTLCYIIVVRVRLWQIQAVSKSTLIAYLSSRPLLLLLLLLSLQSHTDMEFVQKITPQDFQAKHFTPNFNSFSGKKTQKISENGEIYTAGKNFTLPPAVTAMTNSNSG